MKVIKTIDHYIIGVLTEIKSSIQHQSKSSFRSAYTNTTANLAPYSSGKTCSHADVCHTLDIPEKALKIINRIPFRHTTSRRKGMDKPILLIMDLVYVLIGMF